MTRRKPPSAGNSTAWRRTWIWAALGVLISTLLSPILEVAAVRWINPPVTPLMLLRQIEARFDGRHAQQRLYEWRNIGQMPRDFLKAAWVSEDQRFFQHHGFDWREIQLARQRSERTGQDARGASTITMQCARSLFLWQGRSWVRKGLEAYYTFWMELFLSKRRILELYANVIEMGDGVYGIEAAARAHYGVEARALSHNQCVMLAAILPNPREWDPKNPTPKLLARFQKISRQEPSLHFPLADKGGMTKPE